MISISDVDTIANFYPGTLSTGATITNANDRFLANLFAFAGNGAGASPPAPSLPVPTLGEYAVVSLALLLAGFGALRLRRRD